MYGLGLEPPLKSLEPFLSALAKRDSINIRATSPFIMPTRHFHVHLIFVKNVFCFFLHSVTLSQCCNATLVDPTGALVFILRFVRF